MKSIRPISLWRFSLRQELIATGCAALALVAGSWFLLDRLQSRYLTLSRLDAERVRHVLGEQLHDTGLKLRALAFLPEPRRREGARSFLPEFSDLYALDRRHAVMRVYKARPGSRVFEGFSFASSRLRPQLEQARRRGPAAQPDPSPILRGLEDEIASVYFLQATAPAADGTVQLLARLNLASIRSFLRRYSQRSALPLLLVSHDGLVMLSSEPALDVAAIDVRLARGRRQSLPSLTLQGQRWLPVMAGDVGLGAHVVALIPMATFDLQRNLVLGPSLLVCAVILASSFLKNRRLHRQLFEPVALFSERLQVLQKHYSQVPPDLAPAAPPSQGLPLLPPRQSPHPSVAFVEIERIRQSFEQLMRVIQTRDLFLQQKLRTSLTAATIAHEINLPLSTIRLLCQQAAADLQRGPLQPARIAALVHSLEAQALQVSQVNEKMRMLLRNVQTELIPTDLEAVVRGACTQLKRPLREHGVLLSRQLPAEGPPLLVMGDALQLQMALDNLLRNAIEAVAEQPAERRRVLVSLAREQEAALLRVADSGRGFTIDPDADSLFVSTKPQGSGLGLFVVRTTLSNHHGSLQIGRSEQLGGAELGMRLPLLTP
jgi:signal transduction histidine kinase